MTDVCVFSLLPGTTLERSADDHWLITAAGMGVEIREPSEPLLARLRNLVENGLSLEEARGSDDDNVEFEGYFTALSECGVLRRHIVDSGQRLATLTGRSGWFHFSMDPMELPEYLTISRFANLHSAGSGMVLRSPLSHAELQLDDPRVALLLAQLAERLSVTTLEAETDWLSAAALKALLQLLLS